MSLYATYPHLLAPPHGSRQASSSSITRRTGTGTGTGPGIAGASAPAAMTEATSSHGLGAKLRHILDNNRYAIFDVAVTIHELGNVPQLQGEFAAKWKFKGSRPNRKDHTAPSSRVPSAKPSLPNLKLTQAGTGAGDRDLPSSSSISLRSTSTGGSSLNSGQATPYQNQSSQAMKGKSKSTPPTALSLTSLPKGQHRPVEKKGSDPTPLRNSVRLTSDLETVESPSTTPGLLTPTSESEPEEQSTPNGRLGSHPMGHHQDSLNSTSSTIPPSTIGTASSASSSTSYLSVPIPRSTTPTKSSSMERTPSQQTTSGQSATSVTGHLAKAGRSALGIKAGSKPHIRRMRSNSASGPGGASTPKDADHHSSLKGATTVKPLKSHTCTWDHELRLTLRMPIGKHQDRAAALGLKTKAPLLGDGPESSSGLRLSIEEILTPASTSTPTSHPHTSAKVRDSITTTPAGTIHSPAHTAAIKNGSVGPDTGESEEKTSDRVKDMVLHKGKTQKFGRVHIDLAAFAGRGRTTRKFLLKGSRTNATVKISVEMTWVGGERNWAAPPLQAGHHVTAQMKDLMGGRDASEALQKDLLLMKTPSVSSTDTDRSHTHTHSDISRNESSVNLPGGGPSSFANTKLHPQYKTYDHHLLSPDDARNRASSLAFGNTVGGQRASTPDDRSAPAEAEAEHEDVVTDSSSSPKTPTASRSPMNFWNNRQSPRAHQHHHHHFRHLRKHQDSSASIPKRTRGIAELPPEIIIENIFNPHSGHVDGPFTYVPAVPEPEPQQDLRGEAEHHEQLAQDEGGVLPENGRSRLWRRRNKSRTVSSMTITASNPGHGRPSPSRVATGASTATAIHA